MKKIKWLAAAVVAASLALTACSNAADGGSSGGNSDETHEDKTLPAKDLLKANVSNAKYLATEKFDKSNTTRSAAKEASGLVVIKEDGTVDYDALGFTEEFLNNVDPSTAWLHNVLEVYSCDKGDSSKKGTYVVFEWVRDDMKLKDGTPAPLSQIIFINNEGTVFDVLKDDEGSVKRNLNPWIKDYNGESYIHFDNSGNIFMLGEEWNNDNTKKQAIYRWNPADGLDKYIIEENINWIRNFSITNDGSWIFINAMLDNDKYNKVFAIEVNSKKKPITLYESKEGFKWCVTSVDVDPMNRVYFYVNETKYHNPDVGLYIVNKTTSGYSKANVKRYCTLGWWAVDKYVRNIVKTQANFDTPVLISEMEDFDYTALLDYIKSFCNEDKDDVEFTLAYYEDKTNIPFYYDGETPWYHDISILCGKDEDGNILKDEAALKYLFETKSDWYNPDDKNNDDGEALFFEQLRNECYASGRSSKGGFPVYECIRKKGTGKEVFKEWELKFFNADYSDIQDGRIITNDSGVWVYNDEFKTDGEKDDEGYDIYYGDYARFRRIVDTDGQFTEDPYITGLQGLKFYPLYDALDYGGENPSKKLPCTSNSKSIIAVSQDQATLYYQDGDSMIDLLANYAKKNEVKNIYSFNIDEETVLFNYQSKQGGWCLASVDLETKEVTKLSTNKQFDSMVRR